MVQPGHVHKADASGTLEVPAVTVVVVNWNVRELLLRCLDSVQMHARRYDHPRLQTIVIDNASSDDSVEMVRSRFPDATLVVNTHNVGFGRAVNQAIDMATGRYCLLLNPDAEILDGAITAMAAYLDGHPDVGVVGPQLLNPDHTPQPSMRRFPTRRTAFVESTILQRYIPRARLLQRYYCEDLAPNEVHEVDWLVGACLMVRRATIQEVGGLDESFFMYSEELEWCHRIKRTGWKVVYLPVPQAVHHHGRSSDQDVAARHIHFQDSKCKMIARMYGRWTGATLRAFLLGTYVFQLAEECAKLALGHKPALRRQRVGVLWQVLRSGLRG